MRAPFSFSRIVVTAVLSGSLTGVAGAADVSALRDPSMILRVQFDMLDVTPDLPDLDGEEFPLFEESPLDPDEVPLPEAGSQAEGGDTAKDNAKTAKPQEPDLDALFSMLREEDGSQARAQTAHRIQMRWIRSGSATVDLLMARAAAALAAKKPELALDLLDAVVRFKPDYVAGWNRRAAAHFMAGHLGKALVDIERTLALEPRHWGALAGLAAIQQATDKDTAALATYERILEIYPHQEKAEKAVEELRKSTGGVEL